MELDCASLSASRTCGSSSYSLGLHAWALRGEGAGSGLVALAGGVSVCLYHPASGALVAVLGGHGVGVRAVRWLARPCGRGYGDETELASCGGDGLVKVWRIEHRREEGGCGVPHALGATLAGHQGPVCALAALHLGEGGGDVLASTGADCTLRLWHRAPGGGAAWGAALAPTALRCACEAVALSRLPSAPAAAAALHGLLVAVGGTDCRVHLLAAAQVQGAGGGSGSGAGSLALLPMAVLSGHTNWVKSLAFSAHATLLQHFPAARERAQGAQPLYLASAAQDGKCRMWRVDAVPGGQAGGSGAGAAADFPAAEALGEAVEEEEAVAVAAAAEAAAAAAAAAGVGPGASAAAAAAAAPPAPTLHTFLTDSGTLMRGVGLRLGEGSWTVTQDALLSGHTGWLTHVEWLPPAHASAQSLYPEQPTSLLTASMDKTIIVWAPAPAAGAAGAGAGAGQQPAEQPEDQGGVWTPTLHLCSQGIVDEGAVKGSAQAIASGSSLPLLCASASPCRGYFFAADHHGAMLAWERSGAPLPGVTGHYGSVTALAWAGSGRYLLSGSADTTCRAWAQGVGAEWVEIGRPMVHGWEISALCSLGEGGEEGGGHCALVGSAEKVLRVMQAPRHFRGVLGEDSAACSGSGGGKCEEGEFEYAYVPELGLSARGIRVLTEANGAGVELGGPFFSDAHQLDGKDALPLQREVAARSKGGGGAAAEAVAVAEGSSSSSSALAPPRSYFSLLRGTARAGARPFEHSLVMHGRWAETNKLYGHTGDVMCLCGGEGGWVASASAARNEADAAIHVWRTPQGSLAARLQGHRLSVTALAWAVWGGGACASKARALPRVLFSVGRDRAVGVWYVGEGAGAAGGQGCEGTQLALFTPHKRQILSLAVCAARSGESAECMLATGSRDGAVRLWLVGCGGSAEGGEGDSAAAAAAAAAGGLKGDVGAQVAATLALPAGAACSILTLASQGCLGVGGEEGGEGAVTALAFCAQGGVLAVGREGGGLPCGQWGWGWGGRARAWQACAWGMWGQWRAWQCAQGGRGGS